MKRITAHPDVFGGKPIVRDMRMAVELIRSLLSRGATTKDLPDDCPKAGAGHHSSLSRLCPRCHCPRPANGTCRERTGTNINAGQTGQACPVREDLRWV
ncbi:MAG: DUF433 domain-containing protein [Caldilineaceae bacterium]|nr:DUF433 domain-containing protein [Caldilineaceae bacterium]